MKCEVCDTQTATMWVQAPKPESFTSEEWVPAILPSCDDCGPQLGYEILAPTEPSTTR